ncbi:MAG: DNA polymerase IV [Methanomicrobiaceae archaeon]|nr:DNA polymerase IV [Methanomicrobiaceae archaeon]
MTEQSGPIFFHVDMDSFYASVEIRERPLLAGKPVVVGADPEGGQGRGVVSTCSYEARSFGIHSGMPISQAYRLCPYATYLPVRMPLYSQVSGNIMALLNRHSTECWQVSIDEAYLVPSGVDDYGAALPVAEKIQHDVVAAEGITCSIGVGPSRVVAKIASGYQKPAGLTIVTPGETARFLAPLPVGKIPGIGGKTAAELQIAGIETIGQLAECDVQQLMEWFGRWGIAMHELSLGRDIRPPRQGGQKSLGREVTFAEDLDDREQVCTAATDLAGILHEHLAARSLRFRTVTLKVRFANFRTITRAFSFPRFTDDPGALQQAVRMLLDAVLTGPKVRLVGIRLSAFDCDESRQTTIGDYL